MSTTTAPALRAEAVESLYEGLVVIGRLLRARSGDWGHVASDLTRGDIVTLGVLEVRGSIRPGQIATALNVDPSVVSRQLASLDRLDLIARSTDPADGRAELVTINAAGRTCLREARSSMCSALGSRLDHWDVQDIARATAVLAELTDQLHEALPLHDTRTATGKEPKDSDD